MRACQLKHLLLVLPSRQTPPIPLLVNSPPVFEKMFETIMFGFGFGLFGELTRGTAWLYFVPPMWLFMLVFSKWWLDRYRYGPLEWVWRSLSRWQVQPMAKRLPAATTAA